MTPPDPLARTAARLPEVPALEAPSVHLTYRELDVAVDGLAADLLDLRASGSRVRTDVPEESRGSADHAMAFRGDSLAFALESRVGTALLIHAGPRAGFTVAPLNPSLTPSELTAAFSVLQPTAVVADPATVDRVRAAAGDRRVVVVGREDWLGSQKGAGEVAGADVPTPGRRDPRYVVWTSGSSGDPRGVVLTARSLGAVVEGSAERLRLGPSDRWLTTLSPAHVGGLATVLRSAWLGSTLVVRDHFDPVEVLDLAHEGRVTHASLVPVMLRRILAAGGGAPAPRPLRCFLVGGAHAPRALIREAVDLGYPLALTYGMTETSSQAATASVGTVPLRPDTVGKPLPGVRIRIAEDGEIRVRGPSLAAGYLTGGDGPALASLELDEEGWLRTGDLGEWDPDGNLKVTGRRSARIVTGGVTVDPREVEEVLRRIRGIQDVAVVGIPDPEWGERVSAALVAGELESTTSMVDERDRLREAVMRESERHLSSPKRPRLVRFLVALPRTPSDKVDREAIRDLLRKPSNEGP